MWKKSLRSLGNPLRENVLINSDERKGNYDRFNQETIVLNQRRFAFERARARQLHETGSLWRQRQVTDWEKRKDQDPQRARDPWKKLPRVVSLEEIWSFYQIEWDW